MAEKITTEVRNYRAGERPKTFIGAREASFRADLNRHIAEYSDTLGITPNLDEEILVRVVRKF